MAITPGLIVNGFVGGVVATIVMTVFMMVLGDDSPPPTAAFWNKFVGGDDTEPDDFVMQGIVLHVLYGVSAGVALAILAGALSGLIAVGTGAVVTSVVWGVLWGVVLFVVGMAFWMNVVLGMDGDPQTMATMGGFHVVYGVVLGGALGLLPPLI